MVTSMSKFKVVQLSEDNLIWFVEVAAVRMLTDEVKRPELINMSQLYTLAVKGMEDGTAFIVKKGDDPVGALGALLVPNLFNPDLKTLAEIFWYVLPEYRHTRAGALLMMAFEDKAEDIADEATLSLLPSSTIGMDTLEKRGFFLGEFAFRKQIGNKDGSD